VEIASKDPAAAGYTLRDDGTVWAWTAVPASWATAAPASPRAHPRRHLRYRRRRRNRPRRHPL